MTSPPPLPRSSPSTLSIICSDLHDGSVSGTKRRGDLASISHMAPVASELLDAIFPCPSQSRAWDSSHHGRTAVCLSPSVRRTIWFFI